MSVPSYSEPEWPGFQKPPRSAFDLGAISFWLFVFSGLCFATASALSITTSMTSFTLDSQQISKPIEIRKPNTVLYISVEKGIPVNKWSFPEIAVLDADREYLFSFGNELYHETGRDSDGNWTESVTQYDLRFVLPVPGSYYLQAQIDGDLHPVKVRLRNQVSSGIPHLIAAAIAFALAFGIGLLANRANLNIELD